MVEPVYELAFSQGNDRVAYVSQPSVHAVGNSLSIGIQKLDVTSQKTLNGVIATGWSVIIASRKWLDLRATA